MWHVHEGDRVRPDTPRPIRDEMNVIGINTDLGGGGGQTSQGQPARLVHWTCVCVCGAAARSTRFVVENPRSCRQRKLPSVRTISKVNNVFTVLCQQCTFGGKRDLWIKTLTNSTSCIAKLCDKKHAHTAWPIAQRHRQQSSAPPRGPHTQDFCVPAAACLARHSPTHDQHSNGKRHRRPKGASTCRQATSCSAVTSRTCVPIPDAHRQRGRQQACQIASKGRRNQGTRQRWSTRRKQLSSRIL